MWKTKVPSKLRVFLWRLAKNSIPSGDVLARRNMARHSLCALCGCPDSWRHSLLECNLSKFVWVLEEEEISDHLFSIQLSNARDWLVEVMKDLPHDKFVRVTVVLWAIWHAMRKLIHEDMVQSPMAIHGFIDRFLSDLEQASPTTGKKEDLIQHQRR